VSTVAQNPAKERPAQHRQRLRVYPRESAFEKMPRSVTCKCDDRVTAWLANILLPNTA